MCGIAGFVLGEKVASPEHAALLDRMCRVIAHRGPDDQGTTLVGPAGLGMRRLSIIDLAGGHQPMSNEDGSVTVVFNGEIYNYRELRRELQSDGFEFRTDSDTEVIVRAYERYGADCLRHLKGMFAFALWDAGSARLFVARDRTGKKPLYYTVTPRGTFVFGSELKSLLLHPEVGRDVLPEAVDAYLTFGYVPDPLSILRGVHKLPPGHHLVFADGDVDVRQYWDFPWPDIELRSEAFYTRGLLERLDDAVRSRLVADVPLGAFLSGGVDSSVVVGLMSRHSDRPVKTFSVGFHEDTYSELKYARIAARHFKTDHHELIVTPDMVDVVDRLVWHFDEPFADSSAIPTYLVSKLAREHVKVVLSGDGGDEVFAGYARYATHLRRQAFARVPGAIRRNLVRPLSRRLPHGAVGRNYLHNASLEPIDRYLDSVSVFTSLSKEHLYTDDLRSRVSSSSATARFREQLVGFPTDDPIRTLLRLDSKTYLPGDILTKVDRMSMAVSLEARAPLLDHDLIEYASTIPTALKMKGLETKYIFKRAVAELVPHEILTRRKQGFGIPIQEWINNELRERIRDTITAPRARQRGYVEPKYVETLLDEHERNRRDHSTQLWALFMLESWHRTFVDGDPTAARAGDRDVLEGVGR